MSKQSARYRAWRNLCVAGINAGLDQFVFGLEPGQGPIPPKRAVYTFTVCGRQAYADVSDVGYDEVRVAVTIGDRPDYDKWGRGDAFAHCWLERRTGKWIQNRWRGSGRSAGIFRCSKALIRQLAALEIEPDGYADHGQFFI